MGKGFSRLLEQNCIGTMPAVPTRAPLRKSRELAGKRRAISNNVEEAESQLPEEVKKEEDHGPRGSWKKKKVLS